MTAGTGTSAPAPREVVEIALSATGRADLAAVYDSANLLGIGDQPLRLAIRRLVAAGLVEQVGRGRGGSIRSTDEGRRRAALDEAYWDFAVQQDEGLAPWDGRWRLVAFSVPESLRAERDRLRAALARLGAAPLTPGLFVSPHDLVPALEAETGGGIGRFLTTVVATDVQHAGRPVADDVARLWPLDDLAAAYRELERVMDARAADHRTGDDAAALAGHIAVHAALDRAMGPDPLLPRELLRPDWPGARARARVRREWLRPV
jgi:phenylacetic acid degradation operon negative regulatory protein